MGTATILIPGWATDSRVWDSIAAKLCSTTAVERIEWWDCLDGDRPGEALTRSERKAVLVGWSMGSLFALQAAAQWPEQVAGVVIVAGMARLAADEGYLGVSVEWFRLHRRKLQRNRQAHLKGFFRRCCQPHKDAPITAALSRAADQIEMEVLLAGWDYLARADLRALLSAVASPAVVVHGDEDKVVPLPCGEYLAHHLRRGELVMWKGAGHALPLCEAGRLAELIDEFCNDCCS